MQSRPADRDGKILWFRVSGDGMIQEVLDVETDKEYVA